MHRWAKNDAKCKIYLGGTIMKLTFFLECRKSWDAYGYLMGM